MTTPQMFQLQQGGDQAVITFRGQMDAATVQQIKPALQQALSVDAARIIVDLSKVEFLDSHGVGLFVSLLKRAHMNRGRLILAGADGQPAAVLLMVGFNGELVSYCKTVAEAQQLLAPDESHRKKE